MVRGGERFSSGFSDQEYAQFGGDRADEIGDVVGWVESRVETLGREDVARMLGRYSAHLAEAVNGPSPLEDPGVLVELRNVADARCHLNNTLGKGDATVQLRQAS